MDITLILEKNYPNNTWSIGEDYQSLTWENTNPQSKPTEQELINFWPAVEAELLQNQYVVAMQSVLDTQAVEEGFESIFTACTYADEPSVPSFQVDGQALRTWRSLCWEYAYQVMASVEGGGAVPTVESFIDGAPAYTPPA